LSLLLRTVKAQWISLIGHAYKFMSSMMMGLLRIRMHYTISKIQRNKIFLGEIIMDEEELRRRDSYNALHKVDALRFPAEDYPVFYSWLNVPGDGEGMRLLDVACGQGFFLEAVEKSGSKLELHGIDFSEVALDYARTRITRSTLRRESAYNLPYSDDCFDYCVNLGSLEHFDKPDRALTEMHRVLKPNGKIMIIVPNQFYLGTIWKSLVYGEGEDQGQEGVTHFRALKEWTELFLRNNLDITGIKAYSGEDHIAWYFRRKNGKISQEEQFWRSFLNTWVKPLIPLGLSQCFIFMLRRQPLK
jgi:2-polyprenyl-3-methyl-5-hydroxy-6-metoxy-1,4-benzoquinol methylase